MRMRNNLKASLNRAVRRGSAPELTRTTRYARTCNNNLLSGERGARIVLRTFSRLCRCAVFSSFSGAGRGFRRFIALQETGYAEGLQQCGDRRCSWCFVLLAVRWPIAISSKVRRWAVRSGKCRRVKGSQKIRISYWNTLFTDVTYLSNRALIYYS